MITNATIKRKEEGWLWDAILIMKKVDDYECYLKKE